MLKQELTIEFSALGRDACKELSDDITALREKYEHSETIEMIEKSSILTQSVMANVISSPKHASLIKRALVAIGIR